MAEQQVGQSDIVGDEFRESHDGKAQTGTRCAAAHPVFLRADWQISRSRLPLQSGASSPPTWALQESEHMMATWVVVADNGRARIFEAARRLDDLYEVPGFAGCTLCNSVRNLHDRNGMQRDFEQAEARIAAAAHALADFLQRAFDRSQFGDLVLVAAPDFLDELRKELDKHVQASVKLAVDQNLTRCTAGELEAYFRNAA